ncbi:MAG: protein kinase [Gammaproteobacteria bacterium]|nr:protein kinase [Gammaproteobacteria bacterium]
MTTANTLSESYEQPEQTKLADHRAVALKAGDGEQRPAFANDSPIISIADDDAPLVGIVLAGRYRLEQQIGSGGMSDIYRATDLLLEQGGLSDCSVAVKILKECLVRSGDVRQMLLREAVRTRQLLHPNIIRVHDIGEDQHRHYMVMEWLDGESLDQVIMRARPTGLPLSRALAILRQVAAALSHSHRCGIVHTDLKPANIMVSRNGSVRLFDFGVARVLHGDSDADAGADGELTSPLSGYTPTYASPAVLAGESPGVSDDLYAFACICYELLSSRHPYDRLPADMAQKRGLNVKRPAHLDWLRWFPLKRALSFDAEQRPTTISALMAPLERRYTPALLTLTLLATVVAGASWLGINYHRSQQTVHQAATVVVESRHEQDGLMNAPVAELLTALPRLQTEEPFSSAGLLYTRQPELLAHFERQVDELMAHRVDSHPDYAAAEQLLLTMVGYYPDSRRLERLQTEVRSARELAVEALNQQLDVRLSRGEYTASDNGDDPFAVLAVLQRIDPRTPFQPSANARAAFVKRYQGAEATHDVVALKGLLKVGSAFFAYDAEAKPLLDRGHTLANAIDALVSWQQQRAIGNKPPFPYAEAELFYQPSFASYFDRIGDARTTDQLDQVQSDSKVLLDQLPADFSLITSLRRQLADRYLRIADQLLERGQVRTAQHATRQATLLLTLVNKV